MKRFWILLIGIGLLTGCAVNTQAASKEESESLEEFLSEMPKDFELRFEGYYTADRRNIMDTRNGLLQKDLVEDGAITSSFEVTDAWKKALYEKVNESGVLSIQKPMNSENLTTTDEMVDIEPNEYFRIEVWMNSRHYLITGDLSAEAYKNENEEAKTFMDTVSYLRQTMWDLPEWQALPEASGAYE